MSLKPANSPEYILRFGKHKRSREQSEQFVATDALPGTTEKIEVMRRRAELGHPIFHPLDKTDLSGMHLVTRPIPCDS